MTSASMQRFWDWFASHEEELRSGPSQARIEQLEDRLFAVHEMDWEIGPVVDDHFFAFSPRPDDGPALTAARALLDEAPTIRGWQFRLYKPPRVGWGLVFRIEDNGAELEIDAKKWELVLFRFEDGSFDVVFKPDATCNALSRSALLHAATIVVDGELGEELRREAIREIDITTTWEPREQRGARLLAPGLLREKIARARGA